jgi:hypothetical protein
MPGRNADSLPNRGLRFPAPLPLVFWQSFGQDLDSCHQMTKTTTYKRAYETAKQELLQYLQKRDLLDQKIRKLRHSLKPLGELCAADPEEIDKLLLMEGFIVDYALGFTDAIRRLFRIRKTPLSPPEIRADLLKMGIGQDQVNLLSSIHTVLRRMVEGGEIEKTDDAKFKLRGKL